jgi:dTDP-4-dehydrorhamnose 3,5-epimerase-like enzyme
VIVGKVRFVLIEEEDSNFKISEFIISNPDNYCRLTIPSETWFAFQGIEENNIIMSVSSLIHDPNEVERKDLSSFDYDWSKN